MAAPHGKRPADGSSAAAPPKRSRTHNDGPGKLQLPADFFTKHAFQPEALEYLKDVWRKIQQRNKNKWDEVAWIGTPLPYDQVVARVGEEKATRLDWIGLWSADAVAKHKGKKAKRSQDENGEVRPGPAAFFFTGARLVDEEEGEDGEKRETVTEVTLGESVELNTRPAYHMMVILMFADIHGEMFMLGRWFYKAMETFIAVRQPKLEVAVVEDEEAVADAGPSTSAGPSRKTASKGRSKKKQAEANEDADGDAAAVEPAAAPAVKTPKVKSKAVEHEKQLPVDPQLLDTRRVWIASDRDDLFWNNVHLVNSISKKVKVAHVVPGHPPPAQGECDFWFDQSHDRMFCTFEDYWPQGTEAHRIKMQEAVAAQPEKPVVHVLEFFAGAGGLSFMAQSNADAEIRCCWAVDKWDDACATYQANNPECEVFSMGIDEFLMLCMLYGKLAAKYPPNWSGSDKGAKRKHRVVSIDEVAIEVNAERETRNCSSKGQLKEDLKEEQCALLFRCMLEGNVEETLTESDLVGNETHLFKFVQRLRATKTIPQPGDVDLLTGGPPCQNISGLNRHAKRTDVLQDPKNRLVKSYYAAVKYFNPKYTLMEQVQGIVLRENGRYAKFFVSMLLHLRCQVRIAVIAAGDFGCAQGRFRVFTWGARSGETQLPPFPEPTHRCQHFNTPIGSEGQECRVGFLTEESRRNARVMTLLGDVLSDLPEVDNYCFGDYSKYECDPQTPQQLWLRRAPRPDMATLLQRFFYSEGSYKSATGLGRKDHQRLVERTFKFTAAENREKHQKLVVDTFKTAGVVGLGVQYLCREAYGKDSYYTQIWNAEIGEAADDAQVALKLQERVANRAGYCAVLGMKVFAEATAAQKLELEVDALCKTLDENTKRELQGKPLKPVKFKLTLRDHRPLMCNSDDYLRMCNVPQGRGSFLNFAGVVSNEDGTVCGGHYHAPIKANKKKEGCRGGGVVHAIKRSIHKSTRVDHHDKDGWRGTSFKDCPSYTVWLPTGSTLCPRWCLTYKEGKQKETGARHICYGRLGLEDFPPTVVGRAEPHNMRILHPTQDRVMSIRENARCQGFPDYYVFCAQNRAAKDWRGGASMKSRYQQIGNAVAPPVASALGRCLLMAAAWKVPHEQPIVAVPDPEFEKVMEEAGRLRLQSHYEVVFGRLPESQQPKTKCSIISENKPKAWGEELTVPPEERAEMYDAEEDDGEAWQDNE